MHLSILAGTTSKIVQIPVYDSSSTTGGMLTGLVFNTASLVCWYNREGAAGSAVQISLLTATKGTWTTAGFVAIDGTNMPGWYELDVPNAAIASGAKSVSIELRGATNMVPVNIIIELTATDNQDAVRGGMTALPNAAAAASGGLVVLGTNATAISFTAGMTISSTTGNALALTSSGGNGDGLAATGNGTGAGIHLVPGATGNGLLAIGGATSGSAIKATGTAGNAIALELAGQGSAAGLSSTGGATGIGITAVGGATSGTAIKATGSAGNAIALELVGQGSAAGLSATGGATGIGITAVGGATSGSGLKATGSAGNAIALEIVGQGSAAGISATGGATGSAFKLVGGATSGHGLAVTTTAGDGFNLTPTAGNAITATANGTSKHGIAATGGTAGTSDGASFAAGTGGVDFRANRTGTLIGNITGNLSGSVGSVTGAVGSVTGAVGSVTGAVGSVTGAVGSVTGNVGGNVTGSVGSVTAAVTLSTSDSPVVQSGTAQAGGASTITLAAGASATDNLYNGQTVKTIAGTGPSQVRVILSYVGSTKVATVDRAWATNPDVTTTYAVLATDVAKTNSSLEVVSASVTGAVGSVMGAVGSVTGAVASVTGNVGGNVVGSVASVTGAVGSVTGSVGSVTGAVGSITGNVGGNVVGSVASVTARVTANTDQWAGTTIPAPAVTGVPKVDLVDIAGATVSTSSAQLGVNAVQIGASVPGSATIGTVTTTTTATNLTNAPTSGDLTSTMKTSVENAVWDAARSSHLATGVFGQLGQEILRDNTATAGAASTITLDAAASTTVDHYKGDVLYVYSGTGSGQSRVISTYSAGRVATVVPAWVTTPDNTSKFILTSQLTPLVGTDTRVLTSADASTSGETIAAVTGAVGSVTGAVGSVTGSVGSVTGAVGSVTARVTANTDQWAGTTIPAPSITGVPKVDLVDIEGAAVSTSTAQLGVNAVQIGAAVPGSATIGTVTTTTTATNLTNAPTAGDFTATMKTSLNAATPASVTGNVGGNVVGSVASVTAGVTVTTNNDKTGYTLTNPGANPTGSVVADGGNSATTFVTDRTETVDGYWDDALLLITSGVLIGQVKKITGYSGSTKAVTVATGFTGTPAASVTFQLVNR